MNASISNFFLDHYGLNTIIIAIIMIVLLIWWRVWAIKQIKDQTNVIQAAELRDKVIITRDQYHLKIFQQMIDKSTIIIVGVHGIEGQTDDFKLLATFCRKVNISLITFDRRGLGKNTQDWKFKSLGTDINDLKDVINAVKDKYPKQKIILFGESLGAALASAAAKNNPAVTGLMVSNLITKSSLYQFSCGFIFRVMIGFIFNSNIKMPIYLNVAEISSSRAYITNFKQRYSLRQKWPLRFCWQFKKINKASVTNIRNLQQPTLILQSGDDIFSDFHQLKVNAKRWNAKTKYVFIFEGKHALINEPNFKDLFDQEIMPWITTKILSEKETNNHETNP